MPKRGQVVAEHANHHYVPEYHFKFFNGGGRQICALLKKDGKVVTNAPIKSQSSRHMFYGTVEIEKAFSGLEGLHAGALRALIEAAETGDLTKWSHEHFLWLLQGIAFQRARTMLEVEKIAPAMQAMFLHMFKEHVKRTMPPAQADEILGPIERGEVEISQSDTAMALSTEPPARRDVRFGSTFLLQPLDHAFLAGAVQGHFIHVPHGVLVDDPAVLDDLLLGLIDRPVSALFSSPLGYRRQRKGGPEGRTRGHSTLRRVGLDSWRPIGAQPEALAKFIEGHCQPFSFFSVSTSRLTICRWSLFKQAHASFIFSRIASFSASDIPSSRSFLKAKR